MGAKNIILIGHDCGKVDNEMHVKDYNKQNAVMKGRAYVKWMKSAKVEIKTIDAKRKLKQHWKVNVYSLNPFINFGLEGHKYERFR
jgi:N-dimethylarginine dimethylaminohydrolase